MNSRSIIRWSLGAAAMAAPCDAVLADSPIFAPPIAIPYGIVNASDYATVDVDLDGDLDIVANEATPNTPGIPSVISVVRNLGNFNFSEPDLYDVGLSVSSAFITGDVNNDGFPDIVTTNVLTLNTSEVFVLINDGTGRFDERQTYAAGSQPNEARIGDVSGDGWPDIVITNTFGVALYYENDGAGAFLPPEEVITWGNATDMELADFDSDGDLDLFVINSFQVPNVAFVENVDGQLTTVHIPGAHMPGPRPAVEDVDQDGLPDVVSAAYRSLRVLVNHGNFKFTQSNLISPFGGYSPSSPEVSPAELSADFDLDGSLDLLGFSCSLETNELNVGFIVVTDIEGPPYGLYPDLATIGSTENVIDGVDLIRFLNDWGPMPGVTVVDLNNDFVIDGRDIARLLANWGPLPERPPFEPHIYPFYDGFCPIRVRAIDFDQDGDADVMLRNADSELLFFENLLLSNEK